MDSTTKKHAVIGIYNEPVEAIRCLKEYGIDETQITRQFPKPFACIFINLTISQLEWVKKQSWVAGADFLTCYI